MLVQFSRVTFQYGRREILRNADLFLKPSEVVGLLGLNGTGKTTTMRLIADILAPNHGQISRQFRCLGYLPEERGLYRRLVQLAATLVPRPDLMLWDEPFSGLDALNQELLLEVLKELRAEGVTILLSTHRLDDLELLADRTYILSQGHFTEYTPPKRPARYRLRIAGEHSERYETVEAARLAEYVEAINARGETLLAAIPESGLETVFRTLVEGQG